MKLVVGLGNVGEQYARTRHNLGFMVVDQLAANLDAQWKPEAKFKATVAETQFGDEKLILAKPTTMMNLSGEAVRALVNFYKIDPEDVWVLHDDLDVPFGRLRLRRGSQSEQGSGQRGTQSVVQHLGANFVRIRLGISLNDRTRQSSADYVLEAFDKEERAKLPQLVETAAAIVQQQLVLDAPEESTLDLLS